MSEKIIKPELRFKGFTEEWEEKKYSETFKKIPNNTLSRAELNYNYGLAKNVHYGDVLIKFGELLDVEKDEIPYITNEAFVNKLKQSKLQNGDVIIADAAEDETVGKCTELVNVGEEIIFSGLHTIPSRPTLPFASGYLGYFMNSPAYHNQLLRLMQGTKVLSISKTVLQDTDIIYPIDNPEQSKIGTYFNNLDHLITFHQRKNDKLITVKKAMLEKMFPQNGAVVPEIRFKGFTEAWEEKYLGKEVELFSGLTYSPTDVIKEGGTLVLRSSNVKNGEIVYGDNVYVNSNAVNSDNVREGDIIIVVRNGSRSLIGKHAQIKEPMNNTVIGAFMTGFHSNQSAFINALLDTSQFDKEIEKNLGATINQITNGAFQKMQFKFPDSNEQSKIGSYFTNLDKLITLQKRELEKLKNIKKACLEKMFV